MGADPGVSGAVALLDAETGSVCFFDIPTVKIRKKTMISEPLLNEQIAQLSYAETAIVEQVSSMPRQGVASTFTFGQAYGVLRGVIAANRIPMQFVTPAVWKRRLGLTGADKDSSRALAIQLYPQAAQNLKLKKHHGRADALMLAHCYAKGLIL